MLRGEGGGSGISVIMTLTVRKTICESALRFEVASEMQLLNPPIVDSLQGLFVDILIKDNRMKLQYTLRLISVYERNLIYFLNYIMITIIAVLS